MRAFSKISPEWWDYTTLDRSILDEAAKITIDTLKSFERPGFKINIYDTLQEFYCAEALEYINAWKQATPSKPAGICGPIGPTEQLPLVAQMVNEMDLSLKNCHFWGMDEWIVDGKAADINFPLGFAKADMDLCFGRIRPELMMPKENLHFPTENPEEYTKSYDLARCVTMQADKAKPNTGRSTTPSNAKVSTKTPPTPEDDLQKKARIVERTDHSDPERQNLRRRNSPERSLLGSIRRTVRNMESGKSFHLASGSS